MAVSNITYMLEGTVCGTSGFFLNVKIGQLQNHGFAFSVNAAEGDSYSGCHFTLSLDEVCCDLVE